MAIDVRKFETLTPSLYTTFTIPHPTTSTSPPLRVAVLDSHLPNPIHPPKVAAMIVPSGRESDWIFSAESGHFQLLSSSPGFSRLVIVGNIADGNETYYREVGNGNGNGNGFVSEESLVPLILALVPKNGCVNGDVDVPFLSYEDDVIASVVLEKCVGEFVGEMLVEDIEIEVNNTDEVVQKREFRRRLRFKRTPNLVQTEIRIEPGREVGREERLGEGDFDFQLDLGDLVHSYLGRMAASLKVISGCVEEKMRNGVRPRALCVGVGGGALLGYLKMQLGFMVVGVEADEEVLRISKDYFGMLEDEQMQLFVGDGMDELKRFGYRDDKFDVILVDLESDDPNHGLTAPPKAFLERSILKNTKLALQRTGILVINVIPLSDWYYKSLVDDFREIFAELYEIDVGNQENFVLIATVSPTESISDPTDSYIMKKLKQTKLGLYADQIKKI